MLFRLLVGVAVISCVACSSPSSKAITCGPGTQRVGNECLPIDGGLADAIVSPDAGPVGTQATAIGLDPQHDNLQPSDVVASPLMPLWTQTFSGVVTNPLVVNEVVYVSVASSTPSVEALDIHSGTTVWGPVSVSAFVVLAYDRGTLFGLDRNGVLTAFDATTGTQRWNVQLTGESLFTVPPVAASGTVYVLGAGSGRELYAIDENTGGVSWTTTVDGSDGTVAVNAGAVYVGEPCNKLVGLDASSGTPLWNAPTNCTGGGGATPAVYGSSIWDRDTSTGVVFDRNGAPLRTFPSGPLAFHGKTAFYQLRTALIAVDIPTGIPKWTFTGEPNMATAPVVAGAGGQIFVASGSGKVYELDETTGTVRSTHDLAVQIPATTFEFALTLADNHLVVPAGGTLAVY